MGYQSAEKKFQPLIRMLIPLTGSSLILPAFSMLPRRYESMHFVAGMDIIEFDQLKDRYWQPGLRPILLGYSNESLRQVPAFDYVRLYPEITRPSKLTIDNLQS